MLTVHKYVLDVNSNTVEIPQNAKILHVNIQANTYDPDQICLWAEVDSKSPMRKIQVHAIETGGNVPEDCSYFDTLHLDEGKYVLHIYIGSMYSKR